MQCNVSTGCRIGPEQKTAAIKLNDKGVPACPVTSDEILKYRLKHGYNDFDPEKGVYYADFGARSRMSSKQSSVEATGF